MCMAGKWALWVMLGTHCQTLFKYTSLFKDLIVLSLHSTLKVYRKSYEIIYYHLIFFVFVCLLRGFLFFVFFLPHLFSGYLCSFPGVKLPGFEVSYSHPPSAELKNEWSYTSAPPVFLYGVDRENFTFYFYLTFSLSFLVSLPV